ncbi:MAG: ferredoxin family protein [Deltaproteobacteria bacterium]|nr:ferredoxin family protein [Deltaproteobacteria bacterium]
MTQKKVYALPNVSTPNRPVIFNAKECNGCNICVEVCQMDVLIPNPEKGKPPIILFPEECWYGGCCVEHCPTSGAIKFNHPLMQRVRWKRKETGEHFRV